MHVWAWVLIGAVAVIALLARRFYVRWRGMCRGVREELTALVKERYAPAEVVGERMGNLLVRCADGEERVWEMTDIYAGVAQLPGMGADPQARRKLYLRAAEAFFAPAADAPLSPATHGDRIKPRLVRTDALAQSPEAVSTPVPGLDLRVAYALDLPQGSRYLTQADCRDLGLDAEALHQKALANLRKDFPREMLAQPLEHGSGSAIQFSDGFDGTRLLLVPECLQPGQAVIALAPHQDMLLLLPPDQDEAKLREGLRLLECGDHPPLLDRPVRVTSAGFDPLFADA